MDSLEAEYQKDYVNCSRFSRFNNKLSFIDRWNWRHIKRWPFESREITFFYFSFHPCLQKIKLQKIHSMTSTSTEHKLIVSLLPLIVVNFQIIPSSLFWSLTIKFNFPWTTSVLQNARVMITYSLSLSCFLRGEHFPTIFLRYS